MIKLTFTYSTLFSQDLIDVINVFDSFKNEDNSCEFETEFVRWAYTPYSEHRYYRKMLCIERFEGKVGLPHRLIEFDSKDALEEIISSVLYEQEYGHLDELVKEKFYD